MSAHLLYLRYVTRHKWFVFVACCQLGIPWRGLIHDWSKFLPCEWFPYVRKFYWPARGSVFTVYGDARARMIQSGYRFKEDIDRDFDAAWLHHQHTNKHHWQYWVLRNDDGDTRILRMPDKYMREMLADWRGAGRALGKPDTTGWYLRNRDHILLHSQTQEWVENELGIAG